MNWHEVCNSPYFKDLPFKIELNRWGQVVMSPAKNFHSLLQWRIQKLIFQIMKDNGEVLPECSIQTKDNVKVADVAWISDKRFQKVKHEPTYSIAPEICVEVISASNTKREMLEKATLYMDAGAKEVWICTEDGKISFYNPKRKLNRSKIIPDFPDKIDIF